MTQHVRTAQSGCAGSGWNANLFDLDFTPDRVLASSWCAPTSPMHRLQIYLLKTSSFSQDLDQEIANRSCNPIGRMSAAVFVASIQVLKLSGPKYEQVPNSSRIWPFSVTLYFQAIELHRPWIECCLYLPPGSLYALVTTDESSYKQTCFKSNGICLSRIFCQISNWDRGGICFIFSMQIHKCVCLVVN